MLTYDEKRQIEGEIEMYIRSANAGINTRTLINDVYIALKPSIIAVNKHHLSGMLYLVCKHYKHIFIIRTPGYSIIK